MKVQDGDGLTMAPTCVYHRLIYIYIFDGLKIIMY